MKSRHGYARTESMDSEARARRIREMICDIPAGRVASYGQIAQLAGIPRGARQVGRVLGRLEPGHRVPWHRVVRASGTIAFDRESPHFARQRALLGEEGVPVIAGRIDMKQFRWQPDIDELLWKPSASWDER